MAAICPTRGVLTPLLLASTVTFAGLTTGCGGGWDGDRQRVGPEDFVAARRVAAAQTQPTTTGPTTAPPATAAATQPGTQPASTPMIRGPYAMDGMIGQINGRAVFAHQVLEPVDAELAALGRQYTGDAFVEQARPVLLGRLRQIVGDSLLVGAAERSLDANQRAWLDYQIGQQREELLRRHGQGSVALAEANLQRETGRSLEQTLSQFREDRMVQHYLRSRLVPQVNVTRRHVERYYRDNPETFNPEPRRTLRLIRVQDTAAAEALAGRLEAGESFEIVATDPANRYRQRTGGLYSGEVVGDEGLAMQEVNAAYAPLSQGQWAGPVASNGSHWLVFVETLDRPESMPLERVQERIQALLREQQMNNLRQRHQVELLTTGSYTRLETMADALLRIAVSRYAGEPAGSAASLLP